MSDEGTASQSTTEALRDLVANKVNLTIWAVLKLLAMKLLEVEQRLDVWERRQP